MTLSKEKKQELRDDWKEYLNSLKRNNMVYTDMWGIEALITTLEHELKNCTCGKEL